MTTLTAAELGRAFFAAQDRLRGGPDPSLCAPDYVASLGGLPPMPLTGHAGFGQSFYLAFPDLRHDIEDVFAEDDKVAVRLTLRGTHTGAFFGCPPTGRSIGVCANVLMHVRDGRVHRLFGVFDEAGLLRQIGALPA